MYGVEVVRRPPTGRDKQMNCERNREGNPPKHLGANSPLLTERTDLHGQKSPQKRRGRDVGPQGVSQLRYFPRSTSAEGEVSWEATQGQLRALRRLQVTGSRETD